ncbi:MAG: hypothetical protein ACJAUD_000884 [Crocinitomicaceae bacterium]
MFYAEPAITTLENYMLELEFPYHVHYWVVNILRLVIVLVMTNFAGNWFMKNVSRLSLIQLITPFVVLFLVSFALYWMVKEYYDIIYDTKSESYIAFWDFVQDYYNHDWVKRIVNLSIILSIFILYWNKAKKWNRQ